MLVSTSPSNDIKHKKIVIETTSAEKNCFWRWAALKYEQYTITSVLYVLEWWERLIFNLVLGSIFFATIFAMYIYINASETVFVLSAILLGFIAFLLLLCPLHQF
uniref:Uncharacterized protein n=1 Tax=Cryptomonas curvata TaxID=233186 RepID=A0A7S0MGB3_9CRYP